MSWWDTYKSTTFSKTQVQYIDNIQNYHDLRAKAKQTLDSLTIEEKLHTQSFATDTSLNENIIESELIVEYNTSDPFPISQDTYILPFLYEDSSSTDLFHKLVLSKFLSPFSCTTTQESNYTPPNITCFPSALTELREIVQEEDIKALSSVYISTYDSNLFSLSYFTKKWTLNEEQSAAFHMYIFYLRENRTQLPLQAYLGGQGGTGKSQIIKCIQDYANSNNIINNIAITAYTGKAARNIKGVTLHSLLSFQNLARTTNDYSLPFSTKLTLQSIKMLFIDECSMISKKMLSKIESILRWVTGSSATYGGINVILCGDFTQLPPVKSKSALYTPLELLKTLHYTNKKVLNYGRYINKKLLSFFRTFVKMKIRNGLSIVIKHVREIGSLSLLT